LKKPAQNDITPVIEAKGLYMKIGGTGFNLSTANFHEPDLPTTAPIFIVRCEHQSWGLHENRRDRF
jgi:hypothetical protein